MKRNFDTKLFTNFRSDGWPYCPICDEDELHMPVGSKYLKCYYCNFDEKEGIMKIPVQKVEPIQVNRCQTEWTEDSFMTLGPRETKQCNNKPSYIAVEKELRKDNSTGAMSLCEQCAQKFLKLMGKEYALIFQIKHD